MLDILVQYLCWTYQFSINVRHISTVFMLCMSVHARYFSRVFKWYISVQYSSCTYQYSINSLCTYQYSIHVDHISTLIFMLYIYIYIYIYQYVIPVSHQNGIQVLYIRTVYDLEMQQLLLVKVYDCTAILHSSLAKMSD